MKLPINQYYCKQLHETSNKSQVAIQIKVTCIFN